MKKVLFLLLLLPVFVNGQMLVYSVAGFWPWKAVPLGDGGPATAASLSNTEGVWTDDSLNVYFSSLDNRVRKVSAKTGIITTIAGTGSSGYSGDSGPGTKANLNTPYGLYADAVGNVYFADAKNHRVRRVDAATGIITTIAGGGTSLGDGGPATNAQLTYPYNVYLDKSNNIYIGENYRIRKINTSGIITTIAGNGTKGFTGDAGPAVAAQVHAPSGMAFDKSGNLYFADRGNGRIRKISTTGIITSVAGTSKGTAIGDNGPATNAYLAGPIGLAIDTAGNLIIGDNSNNLIRKLNVKNGMITRIAGTGSGIGSQDEGINPLSTQIHPEFVCIDKEGTIYYANYIGSQIRKIVNYYKWLPNDTVHTVDSIYIPPIDTTTPNPPVPDTVDFVFPNAFTPNADNLNDVFRIMGKSDNVYNGFVLSVFNRWGECVFMSHDPQQGWDGVYNGTLQGIGVFFYLCEFKLNNKYYVEKGEVTLVR